MSRQVLVETYEDGGIQYGRVFRSSDVLKIQDYSHEHIEELVRDLLLAGAPSARVAGFGYALAGGLELTISPGHAIDTLGRSFDTYPEDEDASAVMPAANVANPRIDLVVAVLAADVDGDNELLPHRRLLTQLEYENDVPEYDPQNINVPTTRKNTATIVVKQGVAQAVPVAPAAGVNEVALYQVRVEAGAVVLTADKVTDVRPLARSLYNAWAAIDVINASPALANLNEAIDDRVNGLFVDSTYFTKVYDDLGNLFTLDADLTAFDARYVRLTNLDELVDDRVVALLVDSTYITKSYNDTLNQLTLNANLTSFDARYINASGDTMASQLYFESYTGAVFRKVAADSWWHLLSDQTGGSYGGTDHFSIVERTAGVLALRFNMAPGGNATFRANLGIVGALSKGSGTFWIDDLLDPDNYDLVHGFVESDEYMLVYRVAAQLKKGRAVVDMDAAKNLPKGEFARLWQDAEAFVLKRGRDYVEVSEVKDGVFELVSDNPNDTSRVVCMVMAARHDPHIISLPHTDEEGRLIVRQPKPVPTPEELEQLNTKGIEVEEADEDMPDEDGERELTSLIGKRGFPRHAEAMGREHPKQQMTFRRRKRDSKSDDSQVPKKPEGQDNQKPRGGNK